MKGLTSAVFTPLHEDASLDLERIPGIVDHLEQDGVSALYVLGSTGEGLSLTTKERRAVAEAYVQAASGRLPVVIHVGHNCLHEAQELAAHAQYIGANAISAIPPCYFKPETTEGLVACLAKITAGAPELPFYYYHIPVKTGMEIDLAAFLGLCAERLPTMVGVKFSDSRLNEYLACQNLIRNAPFDFVFGVDEMLLSAWVAGMRGAVGTTFNFAAPLYLRIIACFERGKLEQAQRHQAQAAAMVDTILDTCGRPGFKALMSVIGQDCGPHRLPHGTASSEGVVKMARALDAIGFFEWGDPMV